MAKRKVKVGTKFDDGKPDLTLIPYEALEEVAKVLMFGAKLYGRYNWEQGLEYTRVASAAKRHLGKFMDLGQTLDREETCPGCKKNQCTKHSNKHHVAAAIVSLLFLLSFELNGRKELDNRRKRIKK